MYGGDGYNNVNDWMNCRYAQVVATGYTNPTWMASTTDIRAVQKVSTSDRIAARLESSSSFTIDVNITDGQTHRLALYSVDWDGNNALRELTSSILLPMPFWTVAQSLLSTGAVPCLGHPQVA